MRERTVVLVFASAVIVAACSGGPDEAVGAADEVDTVEADRAGTEDGPEDGAEAGVGEAGGEAEDAPEVELFSPTETDEPFDLSGGATSSSEGVEVVTDDPLAGLDARIVEATQPWPTDWTRRTVEFGELGLGLPRIDPRDVIPPIDVPMFESITDATWLGDREPGALVRFNDEVRFYPLSILTRHEIVNDRFGDIPVVVTFCPLCNTALSFDGRVDGEVVRFGVSGLLRNSDLVMWDEATTTLWQQVTGEAIVGELAGTKLDLIPTSIVSYGDVVENFPEASSLSRETGFGIGYGSNTYVGYSSSERPFLFDGEIDPRFPALSRVVGVTLDEESKAYPFERITEVGVVNDTVAGIPIAVLWGGDTADALDGSVIADNEAIGTGIAFERRVGDQELTLTSDDGGFVDEETGTSWTLLGRGIDGPLAGEQLQTITHRNEFWFAWAAFFPDAAVYGP